MVCFKPFARSLRLRRVLVVLFSGPRGARARPVAAVRGTGPSVVLRVPHVSTISTPVAAGHGTGPSVAAAAPRRPSVRKAAHTFTRAQSHRHTHTLSLSLPLSLARASAHTPTLARAHTHEHTRAHTHARTRSAVVCAYAGFGRGAGGRRRSHQVKRRRVRRAIVVNTGERPGARTALSAAPAPHAHPRTHVPMYTHTRAHAAADARRRGQARRFRSGRLFVCLFVCLFVFGGSSAALPCGSSLRAPFTGGLVVLPPAGGPVCCARPTGVVATWPARCRSLLAVADAFDTQRVRPAGPAPPVPLSPADPT
jgi:hypothetical protein